MQKLAPYLWFDDNAEEAIKLYTAIFKNSKIGDVMRYDEASAKQAGKAVGSVLTMGFELAGYEMVALNGGPQYKFTPAVSLFVNCETESEIDTLWEKLSENGQALMPIANYGFSDKFGWVNDRFGVSWQLNLTHTPQKISTALMFVGEQCGNADEAIKLYTSLFDDSSINHIDRYGADAPEGEGAVRYASFNLNGQEFMAMDSAAEHQFTFTEALSIMVRCESQEEVDKYWDTLTADGGEEGPCGWCKDKFGVAWQIAPLALFEMLSDPDAEKAGRAMQAMLQMKKFDIQKLREAYEPIKQ